MLSAIIFPSSFATLLLVQTYIHVASQQRRVLVTFALNCVCPGVAGARSARTLETKCRRRHEPSSTAPRVMPPLWLSRRINHELTAALGIDPCISGSNDVRSAVFLIRMPSAVGLRARFGHHLYLSGAFGSTFHLLLASTKTPVATGRCARIRTSCRGRCSTPRRHLADLLLFRAEEHL